MAFVELAHNLWEALNPTFVLTDNKSVTQTIAIQPGLWNACDCMLQLNFKMAHIAGSVNTAAEFLSRLELKNTEKIRLKIREDFQPTPIEVTAFPRTSLMRNNSSSPKQTRIMSQRNKPLSKKNNLDKKRSNGQQLSNHPS